MKDCFKPGHTFGPVTSHRVNNHFLELTPPSSSNGR